MCLGVCVMFLHTPHMYFRLQPVCSVSLCSVGFANVDDFLGKCVLQKWPYLARLCDYEHNNKCNLKPAISSFYCIFFHFNWIPGSKVMMFYARHLTFYKKPFYVFFQNAHHCNLKKNAVLKNFWGFVSEYVRTIIYVCVFIKSWLLA